MNAPRTGAVIEDREEIEYARAMKMLLDRRSELAEQIERESSYSDPPEDDLSQRLWASNESSIKLLGEDLRRYRKIRDEILARGRSIEGWVAPGSIVTVCYGGDNPREERVVLTERWTDSTYERADPTSPLGKALLRAKLGAQVTVEGEVVEIVGIVQSFRV
ncbi:GreA/GreB family elongation factor [Prescottella agglutinans]|jgi:transcription elongation GreA/GreB family factor|uniref:Transcription elongation GreA/GreB family factor n=1 Tax=Prescottella agglutinans TaxID=1644129 RepID=A0ABT6MKX7_9NOCA|nr:GreA/GreB family elongation factor [Prescottella agglutinans]MDH6284540.1 transcription elongation GreA/GreB family factor [Prescottella agglutinans]